MNAYNIYVDKIREYLLSVDKDLKIISTEEPLLNRFVGNGFEIDTALFPGSFMTTRIFCNNGSVVVEGTDFDLFVDVFTIMLKKVQ